MEEGETFEPLTDCYSEKLSSRVAACISYHPERRPDSRDLVRFTTSSKSGDNSNSRSQETQSGPPPVQKLSKTPETGDAALAKTWHPPLSLDPRPPSSAQSAGTRLPATRPVWMTTIFSPKLVKAQTQRLLGPEHLNTLLSMENRVMVLCSHCKYNSAEIVYRQMLEFSQQILGHEHPDTLSNMQNIAGTLQEQGKYSSAEEIYRQVLELR